MPHELATSSSSLAPLLSSQSFSRAEEKLMAQGYDPVNPFRNGLPDEAHWRAHMLADIALLLA